MDGLDHMTCLLGITRYLGFRLNTLAVFKRKGLQTFGFGLVFPL